MVFKHKDCVGRIRLLYQHNLVNKIHHFVLGGGGAPLYDPGQAEYILKTAKSYNFAIIDLTPNNLMLTVYDEELKVLDSLELKK